MSRWDHEAEWSGTPGSETESIELGSILGDPRFAGIDLDADFDPEAMMRELQEQQVRLEEAHRELADSAFRMKSLDGLFEITVQGGATINTLDIHPEALERYDAHELGPMIVSLISQAMTHGAAEVRSVLGPALGDVDPFPGSTTATDDQPWESWNRNQV